MRYHGSRQIASKRLEPERVVEVLRLQLLRLEREIAPDVGGELGQRGTIRQLRMVSGFRRLHAQACRTLTAGCHESAPS